MPWLNRKHAALAVYIEDFIRFWSALNKNNVEYLMVGGVATVIDVQLMYRYSDQGFAAKPEKYKARL